MSNNTLLINTDNQGICTVTLNRPKVHNAFDDKLVAELVTQLTELDQDDSIRALILSGKGDSFSSGADLNWMRSMINYDYETNYQDALKFAKLLHLINTFSKPTLARINGSAFGGALGLIACCDVAIAVDKAKFCFSELQLGLVPAVISPYIVAAIGQNQAKRLFLTGEVFNAYEASNLGFIHKSVDIIDLDYIVSTQINNLLKSGPHAYKECKKLLNKITPIAAHVDDEITRYTVDLIARLRVSKEGQEGLNAFLNKTLSNRKSNRKSTQ